MLKDKRLGALIELTPKCETAADIGADHGILGCELLKRDKAQRVWFTDISPESLNKARLLVQKQGLGDRASFYVGDGAGPLPSGPDAAIIAGMGGQTIAHIIKQGISKLNASTLLLGANTNLFELRLWLTGNGFMITDEVAVREHNRYYVLIKSVCGEQALSEQELKAGPILMTKTDGETRDYFAYRLRGARLAFEQAKEARSNSLDSLRKEMEIWEKLN